MSKARIAVGSLALSAAALVGLVTHESYTERAVIPTRNDRPTVGFGSTAWEDGRAVRMGDTITPPRAIAVTAAHLAREETVFRASLPGVTLTQGEYDVYVDWVYQFGTGAWSSSSMRRELLAGNHLAACRALLRYKFSGGFDCSIPGNRVCAGVWTRQKERFAKCLEAQ